LNKAKLKDYPLKKGGKMSFSQGYCPECNSKNFKRHTGYTLKNGEAREIFYCQDCDSYFSETKNTPLAGLKTLVSRMALILEAINEGMGLNAASRTFHSLPRPTI
jgi:transposase-like protein